MRPAQTSPTTPPGPATAAPLRPDAPRPGRSLALAGLFLLVSACGGGGGDSTAQAGDGPAPAPAPAPAPPATPSSDLRCNAAPTAAQMLAAINAVRASARNCGATAYPPAAALVWNDALAGAAQGHSDDMAQQNYLSHTSRDGREFGQRAAAAGYNGGLMAENIAAGQTTLQGVINTWLGSPDHCANLMGANYRDVALACASRSGADFGTYWTWMAGAPR
ncbi:MAG: hypothetical protein RLZZ584_4274 [Pseudomonadota bacterium]